MIFLKPKAKPEIKNWIPETLSSYLSNNGFSVADSIVLKHNNRAKRLSLRVNIKTNAVLLTFPASATYRQAHDFLDSQKTWIIKQLAQLKNQTIELKEGSEINILGTPHEIIHTGKMRGLCYRENKKIYVSGEKEHIQRRIKDYLKKEAKAEITWRAYEKAKIINKKISQIRVTDTISRWGSCTSKGVISFSWRLILAPEEMLDYVVAHEVSHLQHMNHSPNFWHLCDKLTSSDVKECRHWFKKHGSSLFNI